MTSDLRYTELQTQQYDYELPPERIAQHPLPERDRSKLLVADADRRTIEHHIFYELPQLLPSGTVLIRNTTRVIPARIIARKPTGGMCELLLIAPTNGRAPAEALSEPSSQWECMVGGRRVREGMVLEALEGSRGLRAHVESIRDMIAQVRLEAVPEGSSIAEALAHLGRVPLPPYIRREPTAEDLERYQTVYARVEGSVAAPTAGLHFTDRVLSELAQRGVEMVDVVLHIGPGTFQPLRAEVAHLHTMHAERIEVERSVIERLREVAGSSERLLLCVGTTSVRTIETLYWLGAKLLLSPTAHVEFLHQDEPYAPPLNAAELSPAAALDALLRWLDSTGQSVLRADTQLYIMPGYRYRLCDAMITNFHQPRSTLLLLVAAFIGPWWRTVYQEALANNYRFLSYGDASLLMARRQRP